MLKTCLKTVKTDLEEKIKIEKEKKKSMDREKMVLFVRCQALRVDDILCQLACDSGAQG